MFSLYFTLLGIVVHIMKSLSPPLVWDDPKLLDDSEEILKSQGTSWRFDSQLWNLLSTWHKTCKVVNCILCFDVGMLAFCLNKINYNKAPPSLGPRRPYTTGWWWIDTQISRKRWAVRFPAMESPLYLS